ncbi:MAG: hypothetical protein IIC41_06970 [Candidatus Marinimicrobia bacterium]|nr:hypothetical protein [Candidatus Neomarinimicrobiota bacterium]
MSERRPGEPDFSAGGTFLLNLRQELRRRGRRRARLSTLGSAAGLGLLFLLSFTALQEQRQEDLWQEYLVSQVGEELVLDEEELELAWELYMSSLMEVEDLDYLLDAVLELEAGADLLQSINLKG